MKRATSAALALSCHAAVAAALIGADHVIAQLMRIAPWTGRELFRIDVAGAILVGGLVAAMEAGSQRGDDSEVETRQDRLLARATGIAVALVMVGAPFIRISSAAPSTGVAIGGALLALSGGLLRARSVSVLGAAFVTSPVRRDNQPLVRHDVYAWIRHPSELGLYAICVGMTILCPSVIAIVATLAVVGISFFRLRREESFLARFREDVSATAQAVGILSPLEVSAPKSSAIESVATAVCMSEIA